MASNYDIIGDIHGRADELEELLEQLGYELKDGVYIHPQGRRAVFLGDFVDKGPEQKRVVDIVRAMVERGGAQAIMGNHEFNAICYALETGSLNGQTQYVRSHSDEHNHQHQKFLDEYEFGSAEYYDVIDWFKTLPVYIELDDFYVVHACWDDDMIDGVLPSYLDEDKVLIPEAYYAYGKKEDPIYTAIENVMKGPGHELPDGVSFYDKNGHERFEARIMWWAETQQEIGHKLDLTGIDLTAQSDKIAEYSEKIRLDFKKSAKPAFVGHYSLHGGAREMAPDVKVLDYKDQVTAYRWYGQEDEKNGDQKQGRNHFVEISARPY